MFVWPFSLVAVDSLTRDGTWSAENFRRMASHWKFMPALRNTLLLTALVVPVQLALALAMASVVTRLTKGRSTILYIFAIPLGISDLAAGLIWLAIFEQTGFLNSVLAGVGAIEKPVLFLSYQHPWVIFLAVVLAEIWRATAIMMVILVAGMGLIPKEYGEAAEVFGASRWQRFVRVTLPMLKPSLQTALILRVILAFEVFAVVVALGGTQMPVLMSETYQWQFTMQDRGVAAAYAMVILGISVGFTLVILRLLHVPKGARL
jgi:multiple sugar transport system permease protein